MGERTCCDCGGPRESRYAEWCDGCGAERLRKTELELASNEPVDAPKTPEGEVELRAQGMRPCPKCQRWLPGNLTHFYKAKRMADGLSSYCRKCMREARMESYYRNKGIEKNLTPRAKLAGYKNSARQRGLSWELSAEQFAEHWQSPCTYCGAEIDTIGLDRKDNAKGYEPGNVVPACITCNRMKGTQSYDEWVGHIRRVLKMHRARKTVPQETPGGIFELL